MTEVRVFDWPRMVAWYVETLGLRVLMNDEPNGFALLSAGPSRLALRRAAATCDAINHIRLVFRVADVDAEHARLLEQGVTATLPADNPHESYREIRLSDPEGTQITLFTWTGRPPS
jgi:catechol 2,3-dioxygenase-like lactoylglutathione lyase family enzyme